jgi:hypothetical protein
MIIIYYLCYRYHGLGGAVVIWDANSGGSIATPLSKDPNHRILPEVMNSLKLVPSLKRIITHPILAQAILEKYGENNSPELEILRKLDRWDVGGSKLSDEVANRLIELGINIVSIRIF